MLLDKFWCYVIELISFFKVFNFVVVYFHELYVGFFFVDGYIDRQVHIHMFTATTHFLLYCLWKVIVLYIETDKNDIYTIQF